MEELKILDNTILIVMDEDKEKVIQYFSEKKRRHAKIFTLSEFMNQYYFSYDERAIYYLKCHYQFQYDVSLMYLSLKKKRIFIKHLFLLTTNGNKV